MKNSKNKALKETVAANDAGKTGPVAALRSQFPRRNWGFKSGLNDHKQHDAHEFRDAIRDLIDDREIWVRSIDYAIPAGMSDADKTAIETRMNVSVTTAKLVYPETAIELPATGPLQLSPLLDARLDGSAGTARKFRSKPPIYSAHVKRFYPNGAKDIRPVDVDMEYTIKPGRIHGETAPVPYELTSFSVHIGDTIEAGHYVAYIRQPQYDAAGNRLAGQDLFWKKNDQSVAPITAEQFRLAAKDAEGIFYREKALNDHRYVATATPARITPLGVQIPLEPMDQQRVDAVVKIQDIATAVTRRAKAADDRLHDDVTTVIDVPIQATVDDASAQILRTRVRDALAQAHQGGARSIALNFLADPAIFNVDWTMGIMSYAIQEFNIEHPEELTSVKLVPPPGAANALRIFIEDPLYQNIFNTIRASGDPQAKFDGFRTAWERAHPRPAAP